MWVIILLAACVLLSGCRVRRTEVGLPGEDAPSGGTASVQAEGDTPMDGAERDEAAGNGGESRENPEASRREYDESAASEIDPGAEKSVDTEGEGGGAFAEDDTSDRSERKLNEQAAETATQTVAADQAERMGVSEDAEAADSAMTYYTVLLEDRMGSLFECKRLNVYWETPEDHRTVHKSSREHDLILKAGCYDVSARLLEENLTVDDGWIGRKNPGVVVKAVPQDVLGPGVSGAAAAKRVYGELVSRPGWASMDAVRSGKVLLLSERVMDAPYLQVFAMLALAKTANPEVMTDVDLDQALEMLAQEAAGAPPTGIFYYDGGTQ